MPRYRTVLFDLDGTLVDSIRLILDSFHHTFAAFGLPSLSDAELLRGVGTPLAQQFTAWAPDDASRDAMVATYRAYNLEHHDGAVRAYPGIQAVVAALRADGIRVGVVTSKVRHSALMSLRVADLESAVEALVCADDVKNPKPHREPVDRALALLGVPPGEAIFVGDSLHDLHAGRAAAVATGAALWGPFTRQALVPGEPTHWLESPEALLRLLAA
ncbi:MAG TPA: HAD-IA family hydrolase [Candidatus Nanopelagicales bacterium]|nr:HAD-IA family hydrolase [Candidatus Nanopelagicales bacterium]